MQDKKPQRLYVIKRNGEHQPILFDKISSRIRKLCYDLDKDIVDPVKIAMKTFDGIYAGVTTSILDELTAENSASLSTEHPDYGVLASRIVIDNLHKSTKKNFSHVFQDLTLWICNRTGKEIKYLDSNINNWVQKNAKELDAMIVHSRDENMDYFGIKTLERSYLLKINEKIVERPQHMIMRVAVGFFWQLNDLALIQKVYDWMSKKFFTHATPTLFNSCSLFPQLSSCFVLTMQDDSIEGIYDTLKECAGISKYAGGVGLAVHKIRAAGSYIRGTNGVSNGLVPMLRVFNNTALYVDQGGGKRRGSFSIYLEPWHADIYEWLALKKPHGAEEDRARDLFYSLWLNDVFMKRVENDEMWSLMCPNDCPGLDLVYGKEFQDLYEKYESKNCYRRQVKARHLWSKITSSLIETSGPCILHKDHVNEKSNQKNIGTIQLSNLCTEIMQYTSPQETAVCNLSSIALNTFVKDKKFQFQELYEITRQICQNLNRVIDITYYPNQKAKYSNQRHRPIGIGVQGLADCFILMRYPFESQEAQDLNIQIFETIYYAACEESMELSKIHGPYASFQGSPMSQGLFQFDLWNVKPTSLWNFDALRENILKYGMYNSLLVALMPTASTSNILGNNECFEPYTSNIYVRRVLSGEFIMINKHLVRDLLDLNLWNTTLKDEIIAHDGSIQFIDSIPQDIKNLYKTVWEIHAKIIIDMAAARGAYVCQSQSMNIFMKDPAPNKISSMLFYGWKKGLKTGLYYLRTPKNITSTKVTLDVQQVNKAQKRLREEETSNVKKLKTNDEVCSRLNPNCDSCGS